MAARACGGKKRQIRRGVNLAWVALALGSIPESILDQYSRRRGRRATNLLETLGHLSVTPCHTLLARLWDLRCPIPASHRPAVGTEAACSRRNLPGRGPAFTEIVLSTHTSGNARGPRRREPIVGPVSVDSSPPPSSPAQACHPRPPDDWRHAGSLLFLGLAPFPDPAAHRALSRPLDTKGCRDALPRSWSRFVWLPGRAWRRGAAALAHSAAGRPLAGRIVTRTSRSARVGHCQWNHTPKSVQ